MFCMNCGNSLPDGVNFCAQCGTRTTPNNQSPNQGHNAATPYNSVHKPAQPNSYLAWAIILTIFGFFPFGIVSIIYASKVSGFYASGDYEMAQRASKSALIWINASWITIVVFWIFFLLIGNFISSMY